MIYLCRRSGSSGRRFLLGQGRALRLGGNLAEAAALFARCSPNVLLVGPAAPENSAAASSPQDLVAIPDVRAYFDYFAEKRLTTRGFEVRFVYDYQYGYANRGVTWATDPAIGTRAERGSTVTVYATPLDRPQPQF